MKSKITVEALEAYLLERYGGWANEQSLFMKLVEEMGEVAEILNKRARRKATEGEDLVHELGVELCDMIHYVVAIAAINHVNLSQVMLEKDKKASAKYGHDTNLEAFLREREECDPK